LTAAHVEEASVMRGREHTAGGIERTSVESLAEGRSSERRGIRKHAILHCHDRVQTVVIRDISAGGMKVQNAFGLIPGDVVKIELLTRRSFDGKVAWSVPPYCGIRFDKPMSESDPLLAVPAQGEEHG
jgi:hypothetical protein